MPPAGGGCMIWRFKCPECDAVLLEVPATTGIVRQERKCPRCNLPVLIQHAERLAILERVER